MAIDRAENPVIEKPKESLPIGPQSLAHWKCGTAIEFEKENHLN